MLKGYDQNKTSAKEEPATMQSESKKGRGSLQKRNRRFRVHRQVNKTA